MPALRVLSAPDAELKAFEDLRRWRTERAREQMVPPYVICTDAVLRNIAASRPTALDGLRTVRGFGEAKVARYGNEVLAVLHGQPDLKDTWLVANPADIEGGAFVVVHVPPGHAKLMLERAAGLGDALAATFDGLGTAFLVAYDQNLELERWFDGPRGAASPAWRVALTPAEASTVQAACQEPSRFTTTVSREHFRVEVDMLEEVFASPWIPLAVLSDDLARARVDMAPRLVLR